MGFGLILAGFILLFNPVVHIVDLLPDVIGFALISAGLAKTSLMVGELSTARENFVKLMFVELVKTLSIIALPSLDGTMRLLLAFVFGLIEILLFVPALNSLTEGLSFAGLWFHGAAVFKKSKKKAVRLKYEGEKIKGINRVEIEREKITSVRNFTLFFYIFRIVMTVLPELTELQLYESVGSVSSYGRSLASFKPLFYSLEFIIVGIVGIIYICKISPFWFSLSKDTEFVRNLNDKYVNDVLCRDTFFTARRMKLVLILFAASMIFSIPLRSDGVVLFVGVISSGFVVASAYLMSKYSKAVLMVIPFALARGILSVVNLIQQVHFFDDHIERDVYYFEKLYDGYYKMSYSILVEYIVAMISVIILTVMIARVVRIHLGSFGIKHESVQYSKKRRDDEKFRSIIKRAVVAIVLTVIAMGTAAAYPFAKVYYDIYSLVEIAVIAVYIIYMLVFLDYIQRTVYEEESDFWR